MAEIIHKVIGAGESDTNPIIVQLDCETSAGTMSWVGREILSDNCGCNKYYDNKYYISINGETEGVESYTWENIPVYYRSVLNCPSEEHDICTSCTCSDLSSYAVPSNVKEGYIGDVEIYYEYYITCKNKKNEVCSREKITGVDNIKYPTDLTEGKYILKVCDGALQSTITFTTYDDNDTCKDETTIDLFLTISKNEVSWEGETISLIYSFVKEVKSEDCSSEKIVGSVSENWTIPECSSPSEDKPKYCCKDNTITVDTNVGTIITKLGLTLGEDDVIIYDGEVVGTETPIKYSVVQKAKDTGECEKVCEYKTTYCADQTSLKVWCEMNGEWVEAKTSPDDDEHNGVVSEYGGRIKLEFRCTPTIIFEDCSVLEPKASIKKVIINVPPCYERESITGPYYYYFKDGEQTEGCESCGGDTDGGTIVYNKISYNFVQECQATCNYKIEPTMGDSCNDNKPIFTATTI